MSDERRSKINRFLNNISNIESSGGKNFDHKKINYGMHRGHRAIGRYGLMPNTVKEVVNRMKASGLASPELVSTARQSPDVMKKLLEANPEQESRLAEFLANKVLDNQNDDEEKAAYSWIQGHNLSPEKIEKRKYKDLDYVKKYNKYEKIRKQLEDQQVEDQKLQELRVNPLNQGVE